METLWLGIASNSLSCNTTPFTFWTLLKKMGSINAIPINTIKPDINMERFDDDLNTSFHFSFNDRFFVVDTLIV